MEKNLHIEPISIQGALFLIGIFFQMGLRARKDYFFFLKILDVEGVKKVKEFGFIFEYITYQTFCETSNLFADIIFQVKVKYTSLMYSRESIKESKIIDFRS